MLNWDMFTSQNLLKKSFISSTFWKRKSFKQVCWWGCWFPLEGTSSNLKNGFAWNTTFLFPSDIFPEKKHQVIFFLRKALRPWQRGPFLRRVGWITLVTGHQLSNGNVEPWHDTNHKILIDSLFPGLWKNPLHNWAVFHHLFSRCYIYIYIHDILFIYTEWFIVIMFILWLIIIPQHFGNIRTMGAHNLHFDMLWPMFWGLKTFMFYCCGVQRYPQYTNNQGFDHCHPWNVPNPQNLPHSWIGSGIWQIHGVLKTNLQKTRYFSWTLYIPYIWIYLYIWLIEPRKKPGLTFYGILLV